MKLSVRYGFIAGASFLILVSVQCYLVYNTYALKKAQFYYSEKAVFLERYSQSVMNDVLFAGARAIFDSVLSQEMSITPENHRQVLQNGSSKPEGRVVAFFSELSKRETVGNLIQAVRKDQGITDALAYALFIERLEERTDGEPLVLYSKDRPGIKSLLPQEESAGMRIGGNLGTLDAQSLLVRLSVSQATGRLHRITYTLYLAPVNREQILLQQMGTTLILSIAALAMVVALFFFTFRRWQQQQKLAAQHSDFINNINHEFHTPLTAIQVAGKSLRHPELINNTAKVAELSAIILRQSDRLQGLIAQARKSASLEAFTLQKQVLNLHALIEEVLVDYQLQLPGGAVQLQVNLAAKQHNVEVDPFHFQTLLLNLLDNAVKFNDKPSKLVQITTIAHRDKILLTVRDNGIGMDAATRRQVFQKFYRHNGPGAARGGLGLGLFYVSRIVTAHGWVLELESRLGVGSQFSISIPLKENA